ncbi:CREB-regulated transcription coactivator 1, partial [Armadillidium nasatum]
MAATPRKFQEKIALINERAAQGTAAYEEIMQEVSSLRSQQNRPSGYYCQYPQQGAVSDLITLTQMYSSSGGASAVEPTTILGTGRPHPSLQTTSPHSVAHRHSHLTPPDMLSRSSSDSSLHQTAYQNKIIGGYRKGSIITERPSHLSSGVAYQMHKSSADPFPTSEAPLYNHVNRSSAKPIPTTAGSAVGGPGAGPGGGSLPDLTHVQFIQPMPNPIPDFDHNPSHYSNRPHLDSSPGQFSPRLNGPYMGRAPSSRGTSPGPSPRPSPAMDRKQKTKPYSTPPSLASQRHLTSSKNLLSVPSVVNAHHHMAKAIVTDNSIIHTVDPPLPNNPGLNIFGCPLSPSGSHPTSPMPVPLMDYRNPSSPQISPCASPVPPFSPQQTGPLTQYRCSSPDSRGSAPPSPVSLHHSSPASSPGATLVKPFVYEGFAQTQTASQLNQQFQQITMQSSSLPPDLQGDRTGGGGNGNRGRELSSSPLNRVSIQTSIPSSSPSQIMSHPIPSSPSHIPPSPTHPSSPSHSPVSPAGGVSTPLSQHPATPQTPLTPSVPLPRLVVTDQDGNDDKDLLLNEVSEFSSFIFDDYIFRNLSSLGEEELMSVDQILFINLKGSLIEEQEQLQKIPHHQQVNHPSSPSSNQPQQLSRSLETSFGLSSSPSQIMTLDPLDE